MSFLEDMACKELGSILSSSSNPLASSVMQMINNQPGGLSGLVQQFHDRSRRPGQFVGKHGTKPSHFRGSDSTHPGNRSGQGARSPGGNFARGCQFSSGTVAAHARGQTHAERAGSGDFISAPVRHGYAEGLGQDWH